MALDPHLWMLLVSTSLFCRGWIDSGTWLAMTTLLLGANQIAEYRKSAAITSGPFEGANE